MRKKYRFIGFVVVVLILGLAVAYANEGVVQSDLNDETARLQKLPGLTHVLALQNCMLSVEKG